MPYTLRIMPGLPDPIRDVQSREERRVYQFDTTISSAVATGRLGVLLRDIFTRNAAQANFRLFCPDEVNSNRLGALFEVENRCFMGRMLSCYHLAIEALKRASRIRPRTQGLIAELHSLIARAVAYSREHLEDQPEIRDWTWTN